MILIFRYFSNSFCGVIKVKKFRNLKGDNMLLSETNTNNPYCAASMRTVSAMAMVRFLAKDKINHKSNPAMKIVTILTMRYSRKNSPKVIADGTNRNFEML